MDLLIVLLGKMVYSETQYLTLRAQKDREKMKKKGQESSKLNKVRILMIRLTSELRLAWRLQI